MKWSFFVFKVSVCLYIITIYDYWHWDVQFCNPFYSPFSPFCSFSFFSCWTCCICLRIGLSSNNCVTIKSQQSWIYPFIFYLEGAIHYSIFVFWKIKCRKTNKWQYVLSNLFCFLRLLCILFVIFNTNRNARWRKQII